jgi:hypothetical protein
MKRTLTVLSTLASVAILSTAFASNSVSAILNGEVNVSPDPLALWISGVMVAPNLLLPGYQFQYKLGDEVSVHYGHMEDSVVNCPVIERADAVSFVFTTVGVGTNSPYVTCKAFVA